MGQRQNWGELKTGKTALLKLAKHDGNPIIAPRTGCEWEVNGTFNPGVVANDGTVHLLYRAVDSNLVSRLGYARISDGVNITHRSATPVLEPSAEWEELGCEDPRITFFEGRFLVTYTAFSRRGPRVALASTEDFIHFEKYGLIGPDRHDKDCVIFPERIDGKIALLHRLQSKVQIAYFDDLQSLADSGEFWEEYLNDIERHEVMRGMASWEQKKIGIGTPPIKTASGWLVIYHGVSMQNVYKAGAILLDLNKPTKILARTSEPILEPEADFEKHGVVPNVVFPDGAVVRDGGIFVYYGGADRVCCVASAAVDELIDDLERAH